VKQNTIYLLAAVAVAFVAYKSGSLDSLLGKTTAEKKDEKKKKGLLDSVPLPSAKDVGQVASSIGGAIGQAFGGFMRNVGSNTGASASPAEQNGGGAVYDDSGNVMDTY